jgi:hypothetical protein
MGCQLLAREPGVFLGGVARIVADPMIPLPQVGRYFIGFEADIVPPGGVYA